MNSGHIIIEPNGIIQGTAHLYGAKNAVLVIITSLILTEGVSTLRNVPNNADVQLLIDLLTHLGASVNFDTEAHVLRVDTSTINRFDVMPDVMNKIRASILVMGPLLARFGQAKVAMPGGDLIGLRPINYHLEGFRKMGVAVDANPPFVSAWLKLPEERPLYCRITLEYPSVGATENILMYAALGQGETYIINAALEPEIFDLIDIMKKMGAHIEILPGATLYIKAVNKLYPVDHEIVADRLEAGALLCAAAITGGSISIPNARADHLDIFIEKLREMGHTVLTGFDTPSRSNVGIELHATKSPTAISIKTGPYPSFATDLQPLLMAALTVAQGVSVIEETVYENRMIHTKELAKLGAQITVEGNKAIIRGVERLYGNDVIASDIRASCALVLAGLVAEGQTRISGVHHWLRGYDKLEAKLNKLGAQITITDQNAQENLPKAQISL